MPGNTDSARASSIPSTSIEFYLSHVANPALQKPYNYKALISNQNPCQQHMILYNYVLIEENLRSAPEYVYLANVQPGRLVFSWTASNCSSLLYNIISDCGICPSVTNKTTATCYDLQLMTNASTCHFRISSFVCDLAGNPSFPIPVILKGMIWY